MTEPVPPPMPLGWPDNQLIFCCRCHEYYATTHQPLRPICIDEERRAAL